jgi:hypothetical protein
VRSFRKKPVVIQAVQWTGSNAGEVTAFLGGAHWWDEKGPIIETLEGELHASVGDWIIKGVQGEFYPCKPDIFEATYEEVEA